MLDPARRAGPPRLLRGPAPRQSLWVHGGHRACAQRLRAVLAEAPREGRGVRPEQEGVRLRFALPQRGGMRVPPPCPARVLPSLAEREVQPRLRQASLRVNEMFPPGARTFNANNDRLACNIITF